MVPKMYSDSDDNDNDSDISLGKNIDLNEKCKNGIFSDPKGSVAPTITAPCTQHAENNVQED
jgi:hypothetical protein